MAATCSGRASTSRPASPRRSTLHITVPKGLKAPSNGELLGVDTLPDGRTTLELARAQPNTYAHRAQRRAVRGGQRHLPEPLRQHDPDALLVPARREGAGARSCSPSSPRRSTSSRRVIGPYPFGDEKLGVVETPHKGMEHQTINAYGNGYAKAPEGFDWLFQHEFAHEWFGNQLTAGELGRLLAARGLSARYMQPLYGRWREGEARYAAMMDDAARHDRQQRADGRAARSSPRRRCTSRRRAARGRTSIQGRVDAPHAALADRRHARSST